MPSPIAHTAMGYAVYRICDTCMSQQGSGEVGSPPHLLMTTVALSMLPDLDAILGILMGDVGRFHNNVMHSLSVGLAVALCVGTIVWLRQRSGGVYWFAITLLCYELHVMMDFATKGRGIMLLWPFSWQRYESAVPLFYGFRWSDGWISVRHLWTLVTESGFVASVGLALHFLPTKKRRGARA